MTNEPAFAVPALLERDLTRVRAYWDGLRRGDNAMPFWDDVQLSALPEGGQNALLIEVLDNPRRCRFGLLGSAVAQAHGNEIGGKFLDEARLSGPFDQLEAQCMAAISRGAPAFFRASGAGSPVARLVLPLWGNGRIEMLLVALHGAQPAS